jgi:hypothetical protein
MRATLTAFAFLTIAATLFMAEAFAQESDKLYPVSGAAVTGKISEMTRNNVVMEIRGVKENYPSNGIQRLVYEGEPAQLSRAKEAVVNEQWEEALDALKKVDFKSISRDDIKKDFEYYVGLVQARLAMAGQGDPVAAENRLLNYIKSSLQSYHYFECSEVLGLLAASAGGHDRAVKYFAALTAAPYADAKIKAHYHLGNSQLALTKVAEARTAFGEALAATAEDTAAKRLQKLASVGLLRCDTFDNKQATAIEKLRQMIADSDATDSELFARIYNALGEAHLAAGQEEEAVLAYLHTDLLFTNDPDSHAEALYHLVQLFGKIDPPRAAEAKSKLKSTYGNSAWAKKI